MRSVLAERSRIAVVMYRAFCARVSETGLVGVNPFDACWDRLDRICDHRVALSKIWNDFIEDHPFDFNLVHQGHGVHILEVEQLEPLPASFALELGEWLYNARALLDYIIWSVAACVSGQLPPPDEGNLQYPVYDSLSAWTKNAYRLKQLGAHHREMLLRMQPFNSDMDANYLGAINRLARVDRHRRLLTSTTYLAEMEPVLQVSAPADRQVTLQWGQRLLLDGSAEVARITVTPWTDDTKVAINPRVGIDPDGAEWADSPFWRKMRFSDRLIMIATSTTASVPAGKLRR